MFLIEPNETAFDLRWRMFGIDVRVHPMFWLLSAFLGWNLMDPDRGGGFKLLLLWIACVFVSILVHELGHVLMGRVFGTRGHIVLYSFGGLAVGSSALPNRWQRIAVFFAGPAAGFVLYGLLRVALLFVDVRQLSLFGVMSFVFLLEINLYWGLLNLLPIWPLDGGQISRDLFGWLMPGRGVSVALGISLLCAGVLAANSLAAHYGRPLIPLLPAGGLYSALLFGMLALGSYQAMQQNQFIEKHWVREDPEPWHRHPDDWKR